MLCITKAFDLIDRTALYYKLLNRGINGNLLNVIRSMFSKAECRVKWDSRISDILKSEFGVLQGGMLSPKLFTEFLQDISASFDQDQGIPVDTLLIWYIFYLQMTLSSFQNLLRDYKNSNCSVFVCFPFVYHSKHS